MKNFYRIIFIMSAVLIMHTDGIFAQSNILQGMRNLPQSVNNNPARQPKCKVFIGVPALSNIYFDMHNTGFVIDDIFAPHPTATDSFVYTLDNLEKVLKDDNYLNAEFNTSLINFGFALQQDFYLTFSLSTKITERMSYPKSLVGIKDGNLRGLDTLKFHFKQNMTAYNEFALGLSKRFYGNFTLGVRLKYLSGLANTTTEKFQFDWYTESSQDSMFEWKFNTNFNIKTSAPVDWELTYDDNGIVNGFDNGGFDTNTAIESLFSNHGMAVDFGAEYNFYDKIILSASVIDLGTIKWVTKPKQITQEGEFRFAGIDVEEYVNSMNRLLELNSSGASDDITQDLQDTLMRFINPAFAEIDSYRTSLNPKIFVGANYFITDWLDVGCLYRGIIYDDELYSAFTLSANTNFLRAWSISTSWSMMDNLRNNVGLGVSYRIGLFQWYFMTDNIIPYFWAANESKLSDNLIRNTKRATFQFGINILFNGNKEDHGLME